jgi:hypothetical protein
MPDMLMPPADSQGRLGDMECHCIIAVLAWGITVWGMAAHHAGR